MRLSRKLALYLGALHVAVCLVLYFAFRHSLWLLLAEVLFLASLLVGYRLLRSLFVPLDLLRTGTELIAERDFSTRFRPVGQPELDALVGVYNRMQQELRAERVRQLEQDLFLQKVFAALPAGLLTLDHDGRVVYLNPGGERLLGLAAEDATGRPLDELPSELKGALADLADGEARVVTAPGARRLRLARGTFQDRGFARAFVLLEELTEELRASEKAAYQKLIRMLAHEVNNSVGAVCSLLESCAHYQGQISAGDRADFTGALDVAASRMRHLESFMNGFADVVRLPKPVRAACDLAALLRDVATLLGPELARRRIRCELDAPPDGLVRAVDKNQMEQVFLNVLKNAIEAIGEDGRIDIVCRGEGGGRIELRDTGAGLDERTRAALFTPFFSTRSNGLGLGLTVVHEVLAQHGMRFGLDGAPGAGATFWIQL